MGRRRLKLLISKKRRGEILDENTGNEFYYI